jgi:hypothetical protein
VAEKKEAHRDERKKNIRNVEREREKWIKTEIEIKRGGAKREREKERKGEREREREKRRCTERNNLQEGGERGQKENKCVRYKERERIL